MTAQITGPEPQARPRRKATPKANQPPKLTPAMIRAVGHCLDGTGFDAENEPYYWSRAGYIVRRHAHKALLPVFGDMSIGQVAPICGALIDWFNSASSRADARHAASWWGMHTLIDFVKFGHAATIADAQQRAHWLSSVDQADDTCDAAASLDAMASDFARIRAGTLSDAGSEDKLPMHYRDYKAPRQHPGCAS